MFCRYILAPLAALLLVPGLLGSAAAQGATGFSAIRLRVDRADLMLMNLRVVYERGAPDEYQVNTRIRAGSESQPLGLRGERRSIKQVDLVY